MKKFFLLIVIAAAIWQVCLSDLPDTVWSKNFGGADNYISDCKFTPDGQKIVVSAGSNIYILETLTSKVLKLFSGSLGGGQVLISNDGKYLYASSKVKIDLYTYETLDTLKSLGRKNIAVRFTDLSPDGKYQIFTCVVVGKPFLDSNLVIMRTEDMEIEKILSINAEVGRIIFHPKENYFILQIGKDLTLWDANTYTYIKTIYTDTNPINDLKFSPDGKMLGIVVDGNLKIFETVNYNITKVIKGTDDNGIYKIIFSPNSLFLIWGQGGFNHAATYIANVVFWNFSYIYQSPFCAGTGIDVSLDSRFILAARGPNLYLLNSKGGITSVEDNEQLKLSVKIIPNPTKKDIIAEYHLPFPTQVNITLYSLNGNKVNELVNGFRENGFHSLKIDTSSIPSGSYFLKLECCGQIVSEKLIINK